MTIATFDALHIDILALIFSKSGPAAVRVCHQVCRSLRRVISTNDYTLYLLELDACGYIEPLCPRMDITYADKTRMLRDHLKRWRKNISGMFISSFELPRGKGRVDASARGTCLWSPEGSTGFMFFQLPSQNRGTGFEQWSYRPRIRGQSVAIDPEDNLLAILDYDYTIHLLTLDNQERHPSGPAGRIVCSQVAAIMDEVRWGDTIELFGTLLIGLFAVDDRARQLALVIWNRKTGQQLLYQVLRTRPDHYRSRHRIFDFLSEDTFVVLRPFDPIDANHQALSEQVLGFLDIYCFDLQATHPTSANCVATLILPPAKIPTNLDYEAAFFSSSLHTPPSLRPQVWELSCEDRLVCVTFDRMRDWDNICVSARVLLRYAKTVRNSYVPWAEWRSQAAWVQPEMAPSGVGIRTSGTHLACFKLCYGHGVEVAIFDFKHRRDIQPKLSLESRHMVGPNLSLASVSSRPTAGERVVIDIDNESLIVFRDTWTGQIQTRDLVLITP